MRALPIRVRLTLAFVVAMAVVLTGVGVLVYQRVAAELLQSVDQTLHSQAADAVARGGGAQIVDPDVSGGTTLAQVVRGNGTVYGSQPDGLAPLLPRDEASRVAHGRRILRTIDVPGRRSDWRVLAVPAPHGRAVVVARSLAGRSESLDHLRHELSLILPLALVAASLGGYLLAAGALRPVEAMRRRAAAVTADQPGSLPVPASHDEISRLAVTLNDMLERLQGAFEHERRFVADASHELRTPLALLQTELELALRRPRAREELEEALRSAADETQRLARLAEDLLLIARADRGPLPLRPEPVPADDLLGTVARRFASRAATRGREVVAEPSPLILDADPLRLEQALGNLVDNALEHGGGTVVLSAEERGRLVELHARDEGGGFPEEFRERAFDRFSRADEARGRGGAGLGLSIVDLIARAHGGSAGLRNREGGGADVWVAVPPARADGPAPAALGEPRGRADADAARGATRPREGSIQGHPSGRG